jgi:hypothetical protein
MREETILTLFYTWIDHMGYVNSALIYTQIQCI